MKTKPDHDPTELDAQKDHERVSCGLCWTVGTYRPTNHMIVSVHCSCQALRIEVGVVQSLAHHSPLCDLQLCQRPLNGVIGRTNYNNDYIAPKFRDHLMPARHGNPLGFLWGLGVESAVLTLLALPALHLLDRNLGGSSIKLL